MIIIHLGLQKKKQLMLCKEKKNGYCPKFSSKIFRGLKVLKVGSLGTSGKQNKTLCIQEKPSNSTGDLRNLNQHTAARTPFLNMPTFPHIIADSKYSPHYPSCPGECETRPWSSLFSTRSQRTISNFKATHQNYWVLLMSRKE